MFGNLSSQEQDAIIKLYVAFFARAPEWSGANYWAKEFQKLDSAMSADQKMDNIAERVLSDSYNFSATGFTADMPLETFIKQMYLNALGRGETAFSALGRKAAPRQEEIDYWVNEISAGRETRAGFGLQIFRDAEIFAEGGTASTEEIAKYKFQSAFNANRLAIAKEFVKQENSGELYSDQAIIAGREILKGVPMVRLREEALSQYIARKLAAPEDPSLYERVPPLSASSLVAEITEAEALAVGGSLPSAGGQSVLSLSGNEVSDGGISAGGDSGNAGTNSSNSGASNNGGGDVSAGGDSGNAGTNSGNSGASNNGGGDGKDMLRLIGPLGLNAKIDMSQPFDQVIRKSGSDDSDVDGPLQQNFVNVDLSGVTGENGATIIAHMGGSNIIGSRNADTITGSAGVDTLYGSGGNDIIQGSLIDSTDGGDGKDMLRLTGSLQANMMIDLGQSGDQVGTYSGNGVFEALGPIQQNFENFDLSLVTGAHGAMIKAHSNGSFLIGSKNSDIIIGGVGIDYLYGGDGNDIIQGSLIDSIDGGDGKDMLRLTGPLQANMMIDLGQSGDQVGRRNASGDFEATGSFQQNFENVDLSLVTGANGATIIAHMGGSNIIGSRNADTIRGGAGDDAIAGGGGIDTLLGGAGDDIITGSLIDIMDGGDGQDTIRLTGSLGSNAMIDLSRGGDQVGTKNNGNFWVTGAAQQNFEHVDLSAATGGNGAMILAWSGGSRIIGSAGADIIISHSGVDILTGGAGEDQFVFDIGDYRFSATVGSENFDTITDFTTGSDKLRFAAETTLAAAGTSGGLAISFGGKITGFASGANLATKVAAIANDSRFDGGRKVAFFEDGNHTYIYHSIIYRNSGSNDHHDKMLIKLTDVTGLEALFLNSVSSGRASYVGADLFDRILGTEGNDRLRGHIGDSMDGLGGSDRLVLSGPLDANLMIDLSEDGDQVGIEGSRGNLQPAGAVQQNFEHVDISGVTGEHGVSITAHSGGSRIIGSSGRDEITGGDGADTISGGDDYDIIRGGAGDDRLEGDGGYDWISGGAGKDIIDGGEGSSSTLYGGSGNDIITGGSGRDHMMGGLDRDTLNGLGGDDRLHGGPGDDIITGGTGRDRLEGGGGADIFVFRAGDSGINVAAGSEDFDVISDFAIGSDKLRFVAETALAVAATSDGLTISFGAKITGFASGANLAGKIAAIDSNNRFDIANSVAFFEDGSDSYVYHTGDSADNGDDMLIKLSGVVGAGEMSLANVQIGGIHYLDISFA